MNSFFKLKENKTNIRTEVTAGLTTFFTMAYIIFVNPEILSKTGMDYNSVMLATCIAAGVGTLIMGLLANYPFAQAPGMGLNAFFTFSVVMTMGYTWQQALGAVFISGIIFILLTVTGLRKSIVDAIPPVIRMSIPAGIGMFIAFIGLNNAGIVRTNQGPIIDILFANSGAEATELIPLINSAAPQVLQLGNMTDPAVLLAVIGLLFTSVLIVLNIRTALFFGIVGTMLLGIPMGVTHIPENLLQQEFSIEPTFMKLDITGLFTSTSDDQSFFGLLITLVVLVISFTLVDFFDTIGTLMGTAARGGFLDKEGKLPRINRALTADAVATTLGALLGTSSVTTYIESGSGIVAGGKTGLTAVVVAILFFLSILLAPFAGIFPAAATSPALIIVGVMMMSSLKKVNFDDIEEALPAFSIVAFMPFTYSIANGIAAGLIFYSLVKIVRGKYKEVSPIVYFITLLFIVRFLFV
ncbi:NCS2 family permease [Flammeovirgaceae bacterium SG7u.111]|nr:NCS2 family permease [Flammeovirgaceae bacterium SG7u.132]WPO36770.1 NCS2 family permease [Flammeovirgaceae bacterium SG7u.111]